MAALVASDVSFTHPGNRAPTLKGVSIRADAGAVLCLLGPNGSGKTTLLRCLVGLQGGGAAIEIDGRPLSTLGDGERGRRIAYVPQQGAAVFPYTLADIVVLGRTPHLGHFAVPSPDDRRIAFDSLERLGIAHLANHPFNLSSGGERQLALIARAIAQEAPTIVLDEPTASLDLANQVRILDIITDLAAQGRAVVFSTHDPDHALVAATQAALLKSGRVLAQGVVAEVITETTLSALYDVPVRMISAIAADDGSGPTTLCFPVHRSLDDRASSDVQRGV
jgi:iron complex transport system ATP-binding protein